MPLELTKEDYRAVLRNLGEKLSEDFDRISGFEITAMVLASPAAAEEAIKSLRQAHEIVCAVAQLVKEHSHA